MSKSEQLLKNFSGIDIIGNGVDRCNVQSMGRTLKHSPQFIVETFSDWEIIYCEQAKNEQVRAQRYAGRFAAKEALTKALGLNGYGVNFQEISVFNEKSGKPFIQLDGEVKRRADLLGLNTLFLSITHSRSAALAWCIAVGGRSMLNSS